MHKYGIAALVAAWAVVCPLDAAIISAEPTNFGSDNVRIVVTLDDLTAGGVNVNIMVSPNATYPNTADLIGFFFSTNNGSITTTDLQSLVNITAIATNTTNLGGGNNVNGGSPALDPFDFGLSIGTPGIGSDDYQSASFFVNGATLLNFSEQQFAVRATSVGLPGGSRTGSSKLSGGFPEGTPNPDPDTTVPEPSSIGMMGLGLVSLAWFARRRRVQS